jgi:hypothetical protein
MFVIFCAWLFHPQTNSSSNISVFNRWVSVGACPKCSQIADISRSLADHDATAFGGVVWGWSLLKHRELAPTKRVAASRIFRRGLVEFTPPLS